MPRTRLYRDGDLVAEDFPAEKISDYLEVDDGSIVWLDLCGPTEADFELIRDELGLHQLAVEDALTGRQRPKLDHYRTHLYFHAYAVTFDSADGSMRRSEVGAFITARALVTVRHDDGFDIDGVLERWDGAPDLAGHGVAFLVHGLLDYLIDGHFDAVQQLDDALDELGDDLFDEGTASVRQVQRRSFTLRKSLVELRRVVVPMREVVNALMRPTTHVVDEEMVPYYQDVYDHVLRAAESTDSLRDLVTTILETNLTVQGNRMNSIMKQVTSWAAIIAVPTAVTGFYGQNVPYPGFSRHSGFVTSTVVTVVLSIALYVTFRVKRWL